MASNFQNCTIKNIIVFIYFGCAGSSLLCSLPSRYGEWGLLSTCGGRASHCGGFSRGALALWGASVLVACRLRRCGSQALEHRCHSCVPSWVALQHVGSSQTKDQMLISCMGRQILYHWATREAQNCAFRFDISNAFKGFPGGSVVKESACWYRRRDFDPWVGRSPGEGNGNPLQYSCLGNPVDRGAWRL